MSDGVTFSWLKLRSLIDAWFEANVPFSITIGLRAWGSSGLVSTDVASLEKSFRLVSHGVSNSAHGGLSLGKSPLLSGDVRSIRVWAEAHVVCLRQAVSGMELSPDGIGLGANVIEALSRRCAASPSLAFFGFKRASEIAALSVPDAIIDDRAGLAQLKIRPKKRPVGSWPDGACCSATGMKRCLPGTPSCGLVAVPKLVVSTSLFRAAVRWPGARSFRLGGAPVRDHGCLEEGACR